MTDGQSFIAFTILCWICTVFSITEIQYTKIIVNIFKPISGLWPQYKYIVHISLHQIISMTAFLFVWFHLTTQPPCMKPPNRNRLARVRIPFTPRQIYPVWGYKIAGVSAWDHSKISDKCNYSTFVPELIVIQYVYSPSITSRNIWCLTVYKTDMPG
jgi:hypothetical protein